MKSATELNTPRLFLRAMRMEDAGAVFAYRSDKETNKYQGWIPEKVEDVHAFIRDRISESFNQHGTWFQFVIISLDSGKIIGDIGVHFWDPENKQAGLGYTLNRQFHGKGFALEALTEVLNLLFNKYQKHRVIASVDPANINSVKLLERLNFRKEAHFKESIFANGVWVDNAQYAILKKEWLS